MHAAVTWHLRGACAVQTACSREVPSEVPTDWSHARLAQLTSRRGGQGEPLLAALSSLRMATTTLGAAGSGQGTRGRSEIVSSSEMETPG